MDEACSGDDATLEHMVRDYCVEASQFIGLIHYVTRFSVLKAENIHLFTLNRRIDSCEMK